MKPPRSVWVSGEAVRYMATNGWTRYDLHRPKPKRKARNTKSASARRGERRVR